MHIGIDDNLELYGDTLGALTSVTSPTQTIIYHLNAITPQGLNLHFFLYPHSIVKEITYDTFGTILQDTNKNLKYYFYLESLTENPGRGYQLISKLQYI